MATRRAARFAGALGTLLAAAALLFPARAAPGAARRTRPSAPRGTPAAPSEEELQGERIDPDRWFATAARRWHAFTEKCPGECEACRKEVERTLSVLRAVRYDSQAQGFSAARLVAASLAGLAFLSEGSTLEAGAYKEDLARCRDLVARDVIADSRGTLSWGTVYGLWFLTEVYGKSPSPELKAKLQEGADLIRSKSLAAGGWIHMFGYEIVAFNNATTVALARLEACGVTLDPGFRKSLAAYYDDAIGDDGTVLYSVANARLDRAPTDRYRQWLGQMDGIPPFYHAAHKRPWSAARAGGAVLALEALGETNRPAYARARDFFGAHTREVVFGWGSTQLNMLAGGIAAYRLGGDSWKRYRDEIVTLEDYPRPNGWSRYRLSFDESVRAILVLAPRERLAILRRPPAAPGVR